MVRLELVSVGILQNASDVVLVLRAPHTGQLLIMGIGPFEGRAIAMGLEKVEVPRPMTHDLLLSTIHHLGAKVQQVLIRDVQENTFFATLYLERGDGSVMEVDSRPSDAVACAVRAGAPIFADPVVMALAGVRPDEDSEGAVDDDEDDVDPPQVH